MDLFFSAFSDLYGSIALNIVADLEHICTLNSCCLEKNDISLLLNVLSGSEEAMERAFLKFCENSMHSYMIPA